MYPLTPITLGTVRGSGTARIYLGLFSFLLWPVHASISQGTEFHRFEHNSRVIEYVLVLPDHFDKSVPYPVLLALPPGDQSKQQVENGLRLYYEPEAKKRGWVVISPAAPAGQNFYSGAETALPALLDDVSNTVQFEGGKAHVAGFSNGGRSAYRVITSYPERFFSLTVFPGIPPDERATEALSKLKDIPVAAFVGGQDEDWVRESREIRKKLDKVGVKNTLEVVPGEGHVMRLDPSRLFDLLDRRRPKGSKRSKTN
jgi:dienelactone hydrolase